MRFLRDFQAGSEDEANAALRYLNPALSSSSRLFEEVNRDTPDLQRFVDETAKLVTDVSARDDALSGLVTQPRRPRPALTSNGEALGDVDRPAAERPAQSDSTFVDLRGSLDDLTPLVDDAKPVGAQAAAAAGRAAPVRTRRAAVVRDLSARGAPHGADNDLVELLRRSRAHRRDRERQQPQRNGSAPGRAAGDDEGADGARPRSSPPPGPTRPSSSAGSTTSRLGPYDALGRASRAALTSTASPRSRPAPAAARAGTAGDGVKNGPAQQPLPRLARARRRRLEPEPGLHCDRSQAPIGP